MKLKELGFCKHLKYKEKLSPLTTYMLMRLVICTLYWALMPATVVGKNMVAQARVTKRPLGMKSCRL